MTGSLLSQVITNHLEMAELTDVIWTAIDGLGSSSNSWVQASADLLLFVIQEHGDSLATVRGWGPTQGQGGEGWSWELGSRQHLGTFLWTIMKTGIPLQAADNPIGA